MGAGVVVTNDVGAGGGVGIPTRSLYLMKLAK